MKEIDEMGTRVWVAVKVDPRAEPPFSQTALTGLRLG